MDQVHINSASEEAHAILSLRSGKVLVDSNKDHKSYKDLNEEKDDQSSHKIIPKEDSKDEGAADKDLIRAEPDPEFYKVTVPYPHLLSQPKASTSENEVTLLEAFRQVTITIPLVDGFSTFHLMLSSYKDFATPRESRSEFL